MSCALGYKDMSCLCHSREEMLQGRTRDCLYGAYGPTPPGFCLSVSVCFGQWGSVEDHGGRQLGPDIFKDILNVKK